jgi:hypothetical protein
MRPSWRKPKASRRTKPHKFNYGPEPWREIDGEEFTFWDQWLLTTAHDLGGFEALVDALKGRTALGQSKDLDVEAKCAHIVAGGGWRRFADRGVMTTLVQSH